MATRALVWSIGCVVVLTVAASPARAQDETTNRAPDRKGRVEVTPFVSMGSLASSRIGAAIAFAWTSKLSVEAEVGYRQGEVKALSSSVNLLYDLPKLGRVVPYLAAGAGLEEYGTPVQSPTSGIVAQQKTAFSVNAGGGVKVPVDDNWSVRADARWMNAVGREGPEHWRVYNGVTFRR